MIERPINRDGGCGSQVRVRVRVRVWDLPTRAFHWLLVTGVVAAVVSAKVGGNAMVWHTRLGLLVLALLWFRFAWGAVGGYWSRFRSFLFGPVTLWRYLRSKGEARSAWEVGHNPLGALAVFAMLGLLLLQVLSGLVADDEIATTGPLVAYVDSAVTAVATRWHKTGGQWLLLGLVGLHLLGVLAHRWLKGHDLVGPMFSGDKYLEVEAPASRDDGRGRLLALMIFLAGLGLAAWISTLGG